MPTSVKKNAGKVNNSSRTRTSAHETGKTTKEPSFFSKKMKKMFGSSKIMPIFIRECKTHLDVENMKDNEGKRVLKTCTYRWKVYAGTDGMTTDDHFIVKTEKQVGQPLIFKREDFLTDYEIKSLYPPEPVQSVQSEIDFPCPDLPF